jgi:DNA polymerase IV (DinB-like DNA polymerase)
LKFYIGCSGWRNKSWAKDFYPIGLDSRYFLSYYSKVFNFVYIDLSYSSYPPSYTTLKDWSDETPDDFRFAIKIPPSIVENRIDVGKIKEMGEFLEYLSPLEEKTLCVIISPPRTISLIDGGREWIKNTLNECSYHGYSVVFEFNDSSWYQDLTYNILRRYNSSFAWSDAGYKNYYPAVTSDFIFLKLSGRSFEKNNNEYEWIKLIKQKGKELISTRTGEKRIDFAIIVADTPHILNSIHELLDLKEKKRYNSQIQSSFLWSGRMIIHVDMNAFFPACEEIRDPTLKGKPHAVIMTPEKDGNITRGAVASCSYESRKYGVRSAMSLLKAKELCPQLILKPVDKQYYSQISHQVMMLLEEYADILEQASIDEAYIDCTNKIMQHHQGVIQCLQFRKEEEKEEANVANKIQMPFTVEEYANKIKKSIKEQCNGLLCSIGVAPTKSAAKIASDFKKPDGLTIVYSQNLLQFLEPLEVDKVAGIGIKTSQILKEMGIKTIGQLAKYDVQALIDKFGKKNGLWMWQVANGKENEPVVTREDSLSLSTEETLQKPTKNKRVILEYLINELVDDIYDRVKRRGYEFKTVGIKLVRSDFAIETRETTFSNYHNSKESIIEVLGPLLEKFQLDDVENNVISKSELTSIRKLGIRVSNLCKKDNKKLPSQKTLFDYL